VLLNNSKAINYDYLVVASGFHYDSAVVNGMPSTKDDSNIVNVIQNFDEIKSDLMDYSVSPELPFIDA